MKQSVALPFPTNAVGKAQTSKTETSAVPDVTALSVEFVAKPREAQRVEATIPRAIAGAFKDVTGFAGCLVMISDQEARLITVVTLWTGDEREKRCGENVRWIRALLAPYVDRCLRIQTMFVYLPMPCLMQEITNSADERPLIQGAPVEEGNLCVA
jgi:hypothetical protein